MSSPDFIFREILKGLYVGRYVPGQRLIEADLTREFKVSRGPVREAIQRLAAEGVVSHSLHRGAYIRSLSRSEIRDVLRVIEVLTGLAARLAAERIDSADHRQRFLERFEKLIAFRADGDFFRFIQARNRFYRTLVEIGGSRELDRVLPTMQVHLVRVQLRRYPTDAEQHRFEDYRVIAEAVLAGDPDRAERAIRDHIRHICESIDQLPDDAFAPDW